MGSSEIIVLLEKNSKCSITPVECVWNSRNSGNVQKLCFLMEKPGGFFEKKFDFYQKIAEPSKLAVKRDWKNKTSQNVQNLLIFNKLYGFFGRKNDFVEIAKIKDSSGGCNWNSKTSQNGQKLVSINKITVFFEKKLCFSLKNR